MTGSGNCRLRCKCAADDADEKKYNADDADDAASDKESVLYDTCKRGDPVCSKGRSQHSAEHNAADGEHDTDEGKKYTVPDESAAPLKIQKKDNESGENGKSKQSKPASFTSFIACCGVCSLQKLAIALLIR